MVTRWNPFGGELEQMFSAMQQLRSQIDRTFEDRNMGLDDGAFTASWPRTNLVDEGSTLTLMAEVPGLSEKDIQITLNQDVLTLSGERKIETPEGHRAHRKERPVIRFSRSFSLKSRVNPERTTATVKNGILTVTLEKVPESMPRQIAVTAR